MFDSLFFRIVFFFQIFIASFLESSLIFESPCDFY